MRDIGDMTLYKGKLGEVQLIMWDALPDCIQECPIYEDCPYQGTQNRIKCEMRRRYLESVMKSLEGGVKKKDEMSALSVGLLVAPLFQHLISFKIFEHSLGHQIMGGKGKIHPVYKEIRQTISEINKLLKDLGLVEGEKKGYLDGNNDYYDDMIQRGQTVQP